MCVKVIASKGGTFFETRCNVRICYAGRP